MGTFLFVGTFLKLKLQPSYSWPNLVPTYPTSSFRPGSGLSDLVPGYMTTKTEISEKVVHAVLSDLVIFVLRPVNRLEKESTRLEQGLRPVRPGWWMGMIRVRGFPERDILSLRTLGLGLARFGRPSAGAVQRSEIPGYKLPGWTRHGVLVWNKVSVK